MNFFQPKSYWLWWCKNYCFVTQDSFKRKGRVDFFVSIDFVGSLVWILLHSGRRKLSFSAQFMYSSAGSCSSFRWIWGFMWLRSASHCKVLCSWIPSCLFCGWVRSVLVVVLAAAVGGGRLVRQSGWCSGCGSVWRCRGLGSDWFAGELASQVCVCFLLWFLLAVGDLVWLL